MRFTFSSERAQQATGYILEMAGGALNYTKLLKMLYLSDRESLLRTGTPITGDSFKSMKLGPVLSAVYDRIDGKVSDPAWDRHFQRKNWDLVMVSNPSSDRLSPFAMGLLRKYFERYKDLHYSTVVDKVHDQCPEWVHPGESGRGALPLTYEQILIAHGKQDALDEYEQLAPPVGSFFDT